MISYLRGSGELSMVDAGRSTIRTILKLITIVNDRDESITIGHDRDEKFTIGHDIVISHPDHIPIISRSYHDPITIVIITIEAVPGSIAKVGSSTDSVNRCFRQLQYVVTSLTYIP